MDKIREQIKELKAKEDAFKAAFAKIKKDRAENKAALAAARQELKEASAAEKARKEAEKARKEAEKAAKPKAEKKAKKPEGEKKAEAPQVAAEVAAEVGAIARETFGKNPDLLSVKELSVVRRKYAFINHPDKGGDLRKITWANVFIDTLEKRAKVWKAAA